MWSFKILFVSVVLYLCTVDAKLPTCADKGAQESSTTEYIPYQNEIQEILDAFDNNDEARMEELYAALANIDVNGDDIEVDRAEQYAGKILKYVPDRIKAEGYPSEVHRVTTEDGYILEMHRIPYGIKSNQTDKPRPVVFIMHGLTDSSNGFIVLGKDHSIAYLLADAGYDVWMGNARGTEPSRKHVSLKPNGLFQKKYWSFSWHEIGAIDIPTCIDYILNETKQEKLNYIGFSQGTTSFFVMTSTRPEYNNKIIEANLLAPVAYLEDFSQRNMLALYYTPLKAILDSLRVYKVTVDNKIVLTTVELACQRLVFTGHTPLTCKLALYAFLESSQINCTTLPYIFVNTPAGASIYQFIHYAQMIVKGGFRQFDYDSAKLNRAKYGSDTPPEYDMSQITVPVHLYHSKEDTKATMNNVQKLQKVLPNLKSTHLVPVENFVHVDFIYSRYIRKALNDRLVSNINKANQM